MIKEQNEQNGRLKAQNEERWCLSSLRAPNWQEILSHSGISVLCVGVCTLEFAVSFLDSDCPASTTFCTDPVVCTFGFLEILLWRIWTLAEEMLLKYQIFCDAFFNPYKISYSFHF